MSYYMGVDIGTSSVKSMLISGDGNVAGTEQVGIQYHKGEAFLGGTGHGRTLAGCTPDDCSFGETFSREAAQISCISYSGQMHGLVMVDDRGKLIRNAIIWAIKDQEMKSLKFIK